MITHTCNENTGNFSNDNYRSLALQDTEIDKEKKFNTKKIVKHFSKVTLKKNMYYKIKKNVCVNCKQNYEIIKINTFRKLLYLLMNKSKL